MARKGKAPEGAVAAGGGIRLSGHPRARRQIGMAKGWGGLGAFALVIYLSRGAGLPWPDALLRGLVGGIAGYVAAWLIAVTVWRHIALAELEDLRRRLVAKAEAQAAEAHARAAEEAAARGESPPAGITQVARP
jgi:uncharacterized membrane protein YccC